MTSKEAAEILRGHDPSDAVIAALITLALERHDADERQREEDAELAAEMSAGL